MRTSHEANRYRLTGRIWSSFTLAFWVALIASSCASAQLPVTPAKAPLVRASSPSWSGSDSDKAWAGYNADFYTAGANGGNIFADKSVKSGGSKWTGFWEEVEEIEVAEDAYDFSAKNYPSRDRHAYINEINALCTGFVENMPEKWKGPGDRYDWSANRFSDDLGWAAIAFARAYKITGNADWLAAAKENFNTIWNRAQPNGRTDGSNGLQQTQPKGDTWKPNLDSPVNFTFVIAGYLLHDSTTGRESATYKSRADAVFAWAKANLYVYNSMPCKYRSDQVCSKIYDTNNTSVGSRIGSFDFSYNYGIAIQAATLEGDQTMAATAANWLMYNSNNPNHPYTGTYNGYNVLPTYSTAGGINSSNNCGYNGIALRGIAFGISHGSLAGTNALPWAQANMQSAWNHRNSDSLIWGNWVTPTSGEQYSWDASAALAGMLVIPAPGGYPR